MSALCSRALIDQITQSTTLIDLVDGLYAPSDQEGLLPVALDLVTIWSRDETERSESGSARVEVVAPDGRLLGQYVTYEVDLQSAHKSRNLTKFPGFPFRGLGPHLVVVEQEGPEDKWTRRFEWPVIVTPIPTPPKAASQGG